MKLNRRGFTVLELLIVVSIVVILSALLFPVLGTARAAAKQANCYGNFRQAGFAINLYLNDYDDRYMPVNYTPAEQPNSGNDRTWIQMILPYVGSYQIFRCPADDNDRPRRETTFDQDLVPGDSYSQYYTASLRTNLGYNFVYFSPIYQFGEKWISHPRDATEIESPSSTYLLVDSVWKRTADGHPIEGGSWLVVPPCRYEATGSASPVDTFFTTAAADNVFTDNSEGWEIENSASRFQYGGTYPWHNGRMTVLTTDLAAKALKPSALLLGCDYQPNWNGIITDPTRYPWDFK